MIRTYIDSGILIAAATSTSQLIAQRANEFLDDPNREYVSSEFVRLEVLAQPTYFKRQGQPRFYQTFFNSVSIWTDGFDSTRLTGRFLKSVTKATLRTNFRPGYVEGLISHAQSLANKYGLGGMDAIHLAAAISTKCDEFITSEKPTKPLFKATELKVIPLY